MRLEPLGVFIKIRVGDDDQIGTVLHVTEILDAPLLNGAGNEVGARFDRIINMRRRFVLTGEFFLPGNFR